MSSIAQQPDLIYIHSQDETACLSTREHLADNISYLHPEALLSIAPGSTPIDHAPTVLLANGQHCVPQHYLRYQHTVDSVEQIVSLIDYSTKFPIFVDSDAAGVYLQIGIIGRENYETDESRRPAKIVYGRKWRVEANLPTSEVIQTVFLALKKAREHEIRELFSLQDLHSTKRSTPFNCHHDLPLMAKHPELVTQREQQILHNQTDIQGLLDRIRIDQRPLQLLHAQQRHNTSWIIDVKLGLPSAARQREADMPELDHLELTLLCKQLSTNSVLYELMDELIHISDRHVEEHFSYNGFTRFSRNNDIDKIGEFSLATRVKNHPPEFEQHLKNVNGEVDASRVPTIGGQPIAQRNRDCVEAYDYIEGFLPKGL